MGRFYFLLTFFFFLSSATILGQASAYSGNWIKVYDDGITQVSVDYRVITVGTCNSKIQLRYNIEGKTQDKYLNFPIDYIDCSNNFSTFNTPPVPLNSISAFIDPTLLVFEGHKILNYYYLNSSGTPANKISVSDYLPSDLKWGQEEEFYKDKYLTFYIQFALSPSACDPNGTSSYYRFKSVGSFRDYPEQIVEEFKFHDCSSNNEIKTRPTLLNIGTVGMHDIQSMDMTFNGIAVEKVEHIEPVKEKRNVTISSNLSGAGTETGSGTYREGDKITISAQPFGEFNFVCWKQNGVVVSKSSSYEFTISEDAKFEAFYRGKYSSIRLILSDYDAGSLSGSGKYLPGTTINITAETNYGWKFLYWQNGTNKLSEKPSLSLVVDYDEDITAVFEKRKYNVNVSISPKKSGRIYGSGLYSYNSTANLSATGKNLSWDFKGWKANNKFISKSSYYNFNVKNDIDLKAVFRKNLTANGYGIYKSRINKGINTRFSIDIGPSFFLRPVLIKSNYNSPSYDYAFNKVIYGLTLNLGWRPIETRRFLLGFLTGFTGGSGIYNTTIIDNNLGNSVVSKAYSYQLSFGAEVGVGGPRCKLLARYLNSIESYHFDFTNSLYFPRQLFEVRREIFQLGILIPMGKRRMTNMDMHFNLAHELQWDWNNPSWTYTAAAYPGFDYGGGLYFYFKWFCLGADLNANVQNLGNVNVSNLYLNSKLGFNFSRLYTY